MTYDLFILPVDRAMSAAEVVAEVERRQRALGFRLGHDARLDPFLDALGRRYWQIRARGPVRPPFDLDVARSHVYVGIPWNRVDEVLEAVAEAAFANGAAVWDPQREVVGLPAPFAEAPLTTVGTAAHVDRAFREVAAAGYPGMASPMPEGSRDDAPGGDRLRASYRGAGPGGMDAVSGGVAGAAGAGHVGDGDDGAPRSPERRDALLDALGAGVAADRHDAAVELARWDPDPLVAAALRPLLASDDVVEATAAARGLARQGDLTDLPALMDLLYRLSPADGASQATMLEPLRAALDLAALAGDEIVEGVRARAREWRSAGGRRPAWDREHDTELDELLGEG